MVVNSAVDGWGRSLSGPATEGECAGARRRRKACQVVLHYTGKGVNVHPGGALATHASPCTTMALTRDHGRLFDPRLRHILAEHHIQRRQTEYPHLWKCESFLRLSEHSSLRPSVGTPSSNAKATRRPPPIRFLRFCTSRTIRYFGYRSQQFLR
ncbi:uncharacterized protein K460DRAFT_118222 [Cucurbitaria berberidis CBS 394.84]|uniref:Uncharacterized protein n=1 Tax=Cucurbitaria berberidis CBS 394.84 TaxID=1168544 RepID=A0A9P4L935_9PLEO|nr:uncharacterized protein K460DRAFT_118222 [Cucurbitaria berberidis CBS 394.84]KAF1845978.1 hypothetical protein K460DRAFT_118222 [Cucurbitaria berberidis CBS 394.84]